VCYDRWSQAAGARAAYARLQALGHHVTLETLAEAWTDTGSLGPGEQGPARGLCRIAGSVWEA